MTSGEFVISLICLIESSFLAWGWFCGGFRRINLPPCSERLAYLEREVAEQKEDLYKLRNQLNPVVTWVGYQRLKGKKEQQS